MDRDKADSLIRHSNELRAELYQAIPHLDIREMKIACDVYTNLLTLNRSLLMSISQEDILKSFGRRRTTNPAEYLLGEENCNRAEILKEETT